MSPRPGSAARKFLRILLVEDDESRKARFQSWLPATLRLVWARNAGQALGLLARDRGRAFAGILLDHDLERWAYGTGEQKSGTEIARAIRLTVSRDTPILVHSMNFVEGDAMANHLTNEGFPVTRVPMRDLGGTLFESWLEEVRENADPPDEHAP